MLYDCAIAGGGLAGLSSSILLAQQGYKVILFEQKSYPFHKVCGEYISMESYPFLIRLGLDPEKENFPKIKTVNISAPDGSVISQHLDLGGFGVSRFKLERDLAELSKANGVELLENNKVQNISFQDEIFTIRSSSGIFQAKTCIGSFGKYGLNSRDKKPHADNYIGVKYHIRNDSVKGDVISLHNFKDGYCGISEIEDGKKCLCYLTTAHNLKDHHNSIEGMEHSVLYKNPYLKDIFSHSTFLFDKPVVISNITFEAKKAVVDHVLMAGDAAGAIAPLCGNGMSMAFRSANILSELIHLFLKGNISRNEMNEKYERSWNKQFGRRIKAGYFLQKLFGKNQLTNFSIRFLKLFPGLTKKIIKLTHGDVF